MTAQDKDRLEDPTNCVVCAFDENSKSVASQAKLLSQGFAEDDVHLLQGEADAPAVDTSAKWFADTDKFMKKYRRELSKGHTVLWVSLPDVEAKQQVERIIKAHGGQYITHFGDWVTESLS